MEHYVDFFSKNLDVSPLTGITSNLNARGMIKGSGVSADRLNAVLRITGNGSIGGSNIVDSFKI